MGWHGEVQSGLEDAAKDVDKYPKNTLGWLLAAKKWNQWVFEATSDGNDWEDTGLSKENLPKNCEWDAEYDDTFPPTMPVILIPKFNLNQTLVYQ